MVGSVQSDSIAYKAGMREEDFILEVNNEQIDGLDRDQVVAKILKHSKHVELLVQSGKNKFASPPSAIQTSDKKLRAASVNVAESTEPASTQSRIILLNRTSGQQSYGFSISKTQSGPPYISEIDADSPAHNSSLKEGDLILKLNGINLTDKSYSKILEIAKKQTDKGNTIELETAEPSTFQANARNRTISHSDLAQEDFGGI